jgi:hypothetical protein
MENVLQTPRSYLIQDRYPLWLVLHGAFTKAEQALTMFGAEAATHAAFLLTPQATRSCGDGYCWSFARDAMAIKLLLETVFATIRSKQVVDDRFFDGLQNGPVAGRSKSVSVSILCSFGHGLGIQVLGIR